MRNVLLLFVAILLSGCFATYTQVNMSLPTTKLAKGSSVFIATPENGSYGDREYHYSGMRTASAVSVAFAKFSNNIKVSQECKDFGCLKEKDTKSFDYYIIPEILHWEDRATQYSAKPDRIKVKISVYDSETENELASTIITGKSDYVFGGLPQDLLAKPINAYIESLY